MIKVVVFQVKEDYIKKYCDIISNYFERARHSFELVAVKSHVAMVKYLKENYKKIDIVFFDCAPKQETLGLVRLLKTLNENTSWIFTNGTLEELRKYMIFRPSGFLLNTYSGKDIVNLISRLDNYHQYINKKKNYTFKFDGDVISIPFADIQYFESCARKVILHQLDSSKEYYFTEKLDAVEEKVSDRFIRCHQSYLVNVDLIARLDEKKHSFMMISGEEVIISRRNYSKAKAQYYSLKGLTYDI